MLEDSYSGGGRGGRVGIQEERDKGPSERDQQQRNNHTQTHTQAFRFAERRTHKSGRHVVLLLLPRCCMLLLLGASFAYNVRSSLPVLPARQKQGRLNSLRPGPLSSPSPLNTSHLSKSLSHNKPHPHLPTTYTPTYPSHLLSFLQHTISLTPQPELLHTQASPSRV